MTGICHGFLAFCRLNNSVMKIFISLIQKINEASSYDVLRLQSMFLSLCVSLQLCQHYLSYVGGVVVRVCAQPCKFIYYCLFPHASGNQQQD